MNKRSIARRWATPMFSRAEWWGMFVLVTSADMATRHMGALGAYILWPAIVLPGMFAIIGLETWLRRH